MSHDNFLHRSCSRLVNDFEKTDAGRQVFYPQLYIENIPLPITAFTCFNQKSGSPKPIPSLHDRIYYPDIGHRLQI